MRLVIVGDVGGADGGFHAGDEAMLEALLDELSERGMTDATIVSSNPEESHARYGRSSISRIGFGAETPDRESRERRLAEVLGAVRGYAGNPASIDARWDDPTREVIASIAASDGLVIAGGGNLNSIFPEHVYERFALASIATALGKPVVVSGQSLGPTFVGRDGELVAGILGQASVIGVRESFSAGIAKALGADEKRLAATLDDASWLGEVPLPTGLPAQFVAVTISAHGGYVAPAVFRPTMAAFLDRVISVTDLDIVFVPHVGTMGGDLASGDQVIHRELAELMTSPRVHALGMLDAREVASVTRSASLVVSSRYHPLVFAVSAGVPAIGIVVDDYTGAKLTGALDNVGLADLTVPSTAVASGLADAVVEAAWRGRKKIQAHLRALEPDLRKQSAQWWDAAAAALAGKKFTLPTRPTVAPLGLVPPAIAEANASLAAWLTNTSTFVIGEQLGWTERAQEYEAGRREVLSIEREAGASSAALAEVERALQIAEASHAAASELTLELRSRLEEKAAEATELEARLRDAEDRLRDSSDSNAAQVIALSAELELLRSTRTFRWTSGARSAYGRMRGSGQGSDAPQ